jgi:hypothetical protein
MPESYSSSGVLHECFWESIGCRVCFRCWISECDMVVDCAYAAAAPTDWTVFVPVMYMCLQDNCFVVYTSLHCGAGDMEAIVRTRPNVGS